MMYWDSGIGDEAGLCLLSSQWPEGRTFHPLRLGCIYLEVVSEWRYSTFFPQFGSNPMLQELMVFLMSYRLEDFEWQHNNELPTSLRMILRLVPLVIPAFTQYARTFRYLLASDRNFS
ncbi:hypothetical protein CK203_015841 [Vitis vinifera]|uniref:Uncharacterized protein n=1 Tax=Vitis vinifera TaxID=29760 RepID=A0A438JRH6_VITVI|nr:hypothetical protein CK203_015841 [Vitis vinifera]